VAGCLFMVSLSSAVHELEPWAGWVWGCFWAWGAILTLLAYREPY
jgi:hypothetical protein